jgi:hypothetical protein
LAGIEDEYVGTKLRRFSWCRVCVGIRVDVVVEGLGIAVAYITIARITITYIAVPDGVSVTVAPTVSVAGGIWGTGVTTENRRENEH